MAEHYMRRLSSDMILIPTTFKILFKQSIRKKTSTNSVNVVCRYNLGYEQSLETGFDCSIVLYSW